MTDTVHEWTAEMVLYFTKLHRHPDAYSFVKMAAEMSAEFKITLTRNALIGKARRLGLPMRDPAKTLRAPIEKKVKMKKVRVDAPIVPEEAVAPADPVGGLTIYQLHYGVCKWPLGGATDRPPFQYCGHKALFDRPYCQEHTDIATGAVYKPRARTATTTTSRQPCFASASGAGRPQKPPAPSSCG